MIALHGSFTSPKAAFLSACVLFIFAFSQTAVGQPFSYTYSGSSNTLAATNTGTGNGLEGVAGMGAGIVAANSSGANPALYGTNSGAGIAIWGSSSGSIGVYGTSGHNGVVGQTGSNTNTDSGVWGSNSGPGYGVAGTVGGSNGAGVYGSNSFTNGSGPNGGYGLYGTAAYAGVFGQAINSSTSHFSAGVYGLSSNPGGVTYGVYGLAGGTGMGVYGTGFNGLYGMTSTSGSAGVVGNNGSYGGASAAAAGLFLGDVTVSGNISKGGGTFKIDHPLDPAGKFLLHSFVESPDMMNIYNGVVTLGRSGEAWVQLPEYFQAENVDYRYQLTCLGQFAPVFIAEEIQNNQFLIAGGLADLRVSWTVTGIRNDAWANAHRVIPEVQKSASETGKYLHPAELGFPAEQGIYFHPAPEDPNPAILTDPELLQSVGSPGE